MLLLPFLKNYKIVMIISTIGFTRSVQIITRPVDVIFYHIRISTGASH
jgi:hypothetical protein